LTRQTAALSQHVHSEPSHGWSALKLFELWDYRELLFFLTWRDIIIRYKQTVLGAAWAILQPFLTMIVFTVFFGMVVKVPSDGLPYPLFYFIALVPWMLFANGLTLSSNSLVSSANMIKKVYFPRLAIPVATILAGLVDFALAFVVGLGLMFYYHYRLTLTAFWFFPFLILALVTCLGVGLWFSALNVQYRDIRYVVPFVTQVWLFATPIAYPSSMLSEPWRTLYGINPMAGVVEGFRWALLGSTMPAVPMLVVSAAAALIVLVTGLFYFRRMEKTFADVV
jgi:lipopolysaccharide transport system permease protein